MKKYKEDLVEFYCRDSTFLSLWSKMNSDAGVVYEKYVSVGFTTRNGKEVCIFLHDEKIMDSMASGWITKEITLSNYNFFSQFVNDYETDILVPYEKVKVAVDIIAKNRRDFYNSYATSALLPMNYTIICLRIRKNRISLTISNMECPQIYLLSV